MDPTLLALADSLIRRHDGSPRKDFAASTSNARERRGMLVRTGIVAASLAIVVISFMTNA
jgi:hypothetical protein